MIIIWRGSGILVVLLAVLGIVAGTFVVTSAQSIGGATLSREATSLYGMAIGLLLAALANFFFARHLDDPAKVRTLVDPQTNQTFVLRDRSSLMFIPVRYWTYVMIALAAVELFAAMTGGTR